MGQKQTPGDKVFAAYLADCRSRLGWTLTKTAQYLGLSIRGYQKYERAESAPLAVMQEGIKMRLDRMIYGGPGDAAKKVEPGIGQKKK